MTSAERTEAVLKRLEEIENRKCRTYSLNERDDERAWLITSLREELEVSAIAEEALKKIATDDFRGASVDALAGLTAIAERRKV